MGLVSIPEAIEDIKAGIRGCQALIELTRSRHHMTEINQDQIISKLQDAIITMTKAPRLIILGGEQNG